MVKKYYHLFKTIKSKLTSTLNEQHLDKRVTLGEYTYGLSNHNILLFRDDDSVEIGKYCSFARDVLLIASGEHNYRAVSCFPFYAHFLDCGPSRDTFRKGGLYIGNDVWVGARAVILSGVNIGDGAVIGAGALVAEDVLPYSIVGGVPAKHIKYRFSPEIITELLKIKWWNWGSDKVKSNIDNFYLNVEDFIKKNKI
jgi:acetyltransferase-like isoleucine patch superfamily enzyme